MTAPSIVAGHTTKQDTSATTSRTITTPTYSSGDRIFVAVSSSVLTSNLAISGFEIAWNATSISSAASFSLFYKTAGSEGSSYTITSASSIVSAIAFAVTGAGGVLHAVGTDSTGTSSTATAPAVTTWLADTLRISIIATDDSPGVTTVATLSGHTLLATVTGSSKPTVSVQSKTLASAGTDASQTSSLSGSESWLGVTFAIANVTEAKVTKAGAYVEASGAAAGVTKAGAYVEIDILQVRTTKAGVYLELTDAHHRATKAGVYLELMPPCPPVYISEGNYSVIYGGVDITRWINASGIEALVNEIDASNLASTFVETAPGGINWKVSCSGFVSKDTDDFFGKDAISPPRAMNDLMITIGHWPCITVFRWYGTEAVGAFIGNYKIGPDDPLKEGTTFRADLGISGGPDIGQGIE